MALAHPGTDVPMSTRDIVVCIPTIGLSEHLTPLIETLYNVPQETRLKKVQLAVNSEFIPELIFELQSQFPDMIEIFHAPDLTIYQEWNYAARWAAQNEAYLLLITDDVRVLPETPLELALALDFRPTYGLISADTRGGLRHAPHDVYDVSHQKGNRYEFATWCFMARPEAWQDVDERYRIWYGDDDLIWKVNETTWGVGVLRGEGVDHYTSTTSRQVPWVGEAAQRDGQLWASLH